MYPFPVDHAITEKKILAAISQPFLNQLVSVMCDDDPSGEVHLLLDLCLGGELFTLLQQAGCFDLATATFYSACVSSALTHLHSRKIVYRDLKPENLVINKDGVRARAARLRHGTARRLSSLF